MQQYAFQNNGSGVYQLHRIWRYRGQLPDADWRTAPHETVYAVLAGSGQMETQEGSRTLHVGDLLVVPTGTWYRPPYAEGRTFEVLALELDSDALLQGMDQARQDQVLQISDLQTGDGCQYCMEAIYQERMAEREGYEDICAGFAAVLYLQLRRGIQLQTEEPERTRSIQQCTQVKRYLEVHYREDINLEKLADLVGINRFHLSHVFRRVFGVSPIRYLFTLRIHAARHLLTVSDKSVAEIGTDMGFSSPSYFSQRFHQMVGMSPLEYRRVSRKAGRGGVQLQLPVADPEEDIP